MRPVTAEDASTASSTISSGTDTAVVADDELDAQGLAAVMQLLDHNIKDNKYSNAIISAMAVIGIDERGRWHSPLNYTPTMSAVIKVAWMMAVYAAHEARRRDIRRVVAENQTAGIDTQEGMTVQDAKQRVAGVFPRVRAMVRRFMTRIGEGADQYPVPIDWILETRTYGMHIRFNTTAAGVIDWEGETLYHQRTKVDMAQLTGMFHGMVGEARSMIEALTMVDDGAIDTLPPIPWDRVVDDNSQQQAGYWFLEDERNTWARAGDGFVMGRVADVERHRRAWITTKHRVQHPLRKETVKQYGAQFDRFRALLWCLVHLTAGQPARATESLGYRFQNTRNGGARNMFISHGQVGFVTAYHKNFQQTNQAKIIHRFLPREIGELVVWYLWLVLPFWQRIQGIIKGPGQASAFLWAAQVVRHSTDGDEGHHSGEGGEDDAGDNGSETGKSTISSAESLPVGWREWVQERKWTTDRVRRALQKYSEQYIGHTINIAAWRHMAIAITRRLLGAQAEGTESDEDEDEDGIDDDPLDLQAGHGSHVAGMVYARAVTDNIGGTAAMREKFRGASERWHRLFAFRAGHTVQPGAKRKRERYEEERHEAKRRRLARVQHTDMAGALQQMVGPGTVFRGRQAQAVGAIIRGDTTVVQVAATGEGKSASFMLPSYCAPDSTTIVVVPLVALQDELHMRCAAAGITSSIWQSWHGIPSSSIVFVTPESACTKAFEQFVYRLRRLCMLDRVVVDECHTLLDASAAFRPRMLALGKTIREWGVQRVFLTATLGPSEMAAFATVAAVDWASCTMVRSRTSRSNIAYNVETVWAREDSTVSAKGVGGRERARKKAATQARARQEAAEYARAHAIVEAWRASGAGGRAIVYARTIDRVRAAAAVLRCSAYYSSADTRDAKSRMLETWKADQDVIAATNALGLGIDVPDVRLVVHIGMPRRIRDMAQESGRAGRDGRVSRSVVLCGPAACENTDQEERETAVVDYLYKRQCRRITLDRMMDGRIDREECEEGEEACDLCAEAKAEADRRDRADTARYAYHSVGPGLARQQAEARVAETEALSQRMEEAYAWSEFGRQLDDWADRCVVCRLQGLADDHTESACKAAEIDTMTRVAEARTTLEREVWTKRRFERFSGCFFCGLPQQICDRWDAVDGEEGQWTQRAGGRCQHNGLLVRVIGAAISIHPKWITTKVNEEIGSLAFYKWMGRKIEISQGIQTNQICTILRRIQEKLADK